MPIIFYNVASDRSYSEEEDEVMQEQREDLRGELIKLREMVIIERSAREEREAREREREEAEEKKREERRKKIGNVECIVLFQVMCIQPVLYSLQVLFEGAGMQAG